MIKILAKIDWIILAAVLLLLAISLLALYSVSLAGGQSNLGHFQKQIISIVIGATLMIWIAFYDYRIFSYQSSKLYFLALILLLLVLFLGTQVRGTSGWLGFGIFNFQPVELAKLIMIIFLASFLSKKRMELSMLIRTIASMVLVSIPVFLIMKQPDFGSASIIVGIWIIMILASGINKKNIFILLVIISTAAFLSSIFIKDYQRQRIINFINPYHDPQGSGYNVLQSIIAVGSGGIWGKGLGHGPQSQLNFLPEKHTDFIFAVIAEELGFVGASLVIILFGVVLYRLKEIAKRARDNFGYLVIIGIMAMFFLQILVNIGMNIGILPVAGVPLPFVSYGGSSLISVFIALGLAESIYIRRIKKID